MPGETEKKTETTDGGEKKTETTEKKVETAAAPDSKEKKVESKSDDNGGELANVFDGDKGDKSKEKPAEKAGDLKLAVPDDLQELVGKVDDYVVAAREAGLTQQQLDKFMAVQFDRVKAATQEADEEAERIGLEWKRDLSSDPKLGGANLKATMQTAERGARALGGSALAVKLAKHLRGEEVIDGPTLIRAFHMAGLAQNEDRLGVSGDGAKKDADDAGLSPIEREFKRAAPETWKRMQQEKTRRASQ